MAVCWLRPNRRALLLGLLLPLVLLGLGALIAVAPGPWLPGVVFWAGILLAAAGVWLLLALVGFMRQPRLAYENGRLLVYLTSGAPITVPIDVVECFFKGQGPAALVASDGREAESQAIIVRLAEAAKDYHHFEVKPQLGMWCDGYITIRGTWCEPITPALLADLNARLIAAHREARAAAANSA